MTKQTNILVVDDDSENIKMISMCLKELGYRLLIARTGESAIRKVNLVTPDLILLDVVMPGIDGFETCRRIKANEYTKNIPVIFMTSLSDIDSKIKGFEAGGIDYISKPFQFEEIKIRVESQLKIHFQQEALYLQSIEEEALNEELTALNEELTSMNEELTAMNEELITVNEELNHTRNYLVQSEKASALGNLVAGLAHEINTPIGIAITAASYLSDTVKKDDQSVVDCQMFREDVREASELITRNLLSIGSLIRNFKTVSVDQASNEKREFNIKAYIVELVNALKPMYNGLNVIVDVKCDDKLEINTYPGAIAQIITNLIQNSVVHGFEDLHEGAIQIDIRQKKDKLLIQYEDNGVGMTENLVTKIFDPFFTTKRTKGSVGLGLFVIYNIVAQKFLGNITCYSSVGNGTRFDLELNY